MHFALVDNKPVEAKPELSGLCPGCLQPVIAKCGKQRIHHWAHRNNKMCDSWWETETEWHRSWKNNFPSDWQEVFLPDNKTGEKHIADVRNKHGLVVEFQHSHINPQQRTMREIFYQNMVWVVDGTRLKRDYPRFLKGKDNISPTGVNGSFFIDFPDEVFPSDWIESSVPVIFDFRGIEEQKEPTDVIRNILWCLLPGRAERYAVLLTITRDDFITSILNNHQLFEMSSKEIIANFSTILRQRQHQQQQLDMGMYCLC